MKSEAETKISFGNKIQGSNDVKNEPIIAIDGPSGAGKSTISKLLARRLNLTHIDTGAMYRCVALAALRQGIAPEEERALDALCAEINIDFSREADGQRVFLNGMDVSEEIRTPEVSLLTSRISSVASVRSRMVELQRAMGRSGGVVLEGRDIGTVVFPDADVKFFLTASAEERGSRRFKELKGKGYVVDLAQTIREVEARDAADCSREHSPMIQAKDAVVVDSTDISIDRVVNDMICIVQERREKA